MKTASTKPRIFVLAFIVVISAVQLAPARPTCATCLNPQPLPPQLFGIVGLASGQSAQLNVADTRPVCIGLCKPSEAQLSFLDTSGNVLKDASGNPLQIVFTLNAGQAASFGLNFDAFPQGPPTIPNGPPTACIGGACGTNRLLFRAVVAVFVDKEDKEKPNPVTSTLELVDNQSGRTSVVLIPQGPPSIPNGPPSKD